MNEPARRPVALTVAGTDSSGGAGVAADVKTFSAHGVWGAAAVTAVTAQDSVGGFGVQLVRPDLVAEQICRVAADLSVDAAKTGMLGDASIASEVAAALRGAGPIPLVVDPVLASTSGFTLLDADGITVLVRELLPQATVVTPNLAEAALLAGFAVDDRPSMERAARAIADLGPQVVLVTGGHLDGDRSPDCLLVDDRIEWLEGARIETLHTHGGGCVLSAAICAGLARGQAPADVCAAAKQFVESAIAAGFALGAGRGAVDPDWVRPRGGGSGRRA